MLWRHTTEIGWIVLRPCRERLEQPTKRSWIEKGSFKKKSRTREKRDSWDNSISGEKSLMKKKHGKLDPHATLWDRNTYVLLGWTEGCDSMWWQNGSIIWFHLAIILPKLKNESAPWKGVEFAAPWPASEHCKVSLHFQPRVCEEATGVALSKHWKCPLHSVEDLKDGLHRDNNGMRHKLSLKKKMFYNSTTYLFSATSISYISKFACQSCYIFLSILSHLGNVWQHILHTVPLMSNS